MFKIKPNKKSTTNITNNNGQNPAQNSTNNKGKQLNQNNDIINHQQVNHNPLTNNQTMRYPPPSSNHPTLLRNTSLRPRSSTNNNNKLKNIVPNVNTNPNDQQAKLLSETRKLKNIGSINVNNSVSVNSNKNIDHRPNTSSNTRNLKQQKRNKLLNRKGNNNMGLSTTNIGTIAYQQQQNEEDYSSQYISNSQAQIILLNILQQQLEYQQLKYGNQQQFQKNKQKLVSNISIIVLKWYKILQDRLFNQVKRLNQQNNNANDSQSAEVPQTVEQLISQQIKKHFSKQKGLFNVQQRCSIQQSRLQNLIDKRLQRLESLLTVSNGGK